MKTNQKKSSTLWIDMDVPIKIVCKKHDIFCMTPNDHIGENPEKVIYGCPMCGDFRKKDE